MAVATMMSPSAAKSAVMGAAQKVTADALDRIRRLGMSPRQQALNALWSWYRCQSYAARKLDWDGNEVTDAFDTEVIASSGILPAGFQQVVSADFPLKFRRPNAPYALVKVIVDRFTGLLFSERRHPKLHIEGDPTTEAFVNALAQTARLWPLMIQARQYGGAMGSVAVGFQFLDGRPVVEVHDPRWVTPDFADRFTLQLRSIEKRYMYPVDERQANGTFKEVYYWYRRIIDEQADVLFAPAPVGNGNEPDWREQKRVDHGFGFCPVVWVQNLPLQEDLDGDGDCLGIYDTVEEMDRLIAQANRGLKANCDPTLVLSTTAEMSNVRKGSDNAIKLPDGTAEYLELTGTGPQAAMEQVGKLRAMALEVAQCVLEQPDGQGMPTATEVERKYAAMLEKADVLREQYGEKCIKPIVEMMIRAAKKLMQPIQRLNPATQVQEIVRQEIQLPLRVIEQPGDAPPIMEKHQLGPGGQLTLQWPRYFIPSLDDITKAVGAAVGAKTGGVLDLERAVTFTGEYFGVEDPKAMLKNIKQEASENQAMMAATMGIGGTPAPAGGTSGQGEDGAPAE